MKFNLQFKIISISLFLSLFVFVLLTYFHFHDYRESMVDSLYKRSKIISQSLDNNIADINSIENKNKLLVNIEKYVLLDQDITGINFNIHRNNELKTYISSEADNLGKAADNINWESLKNNHIQSGISDTNPDLLKIIIPVRSNGNVIGTYEFNFTLENINTEISNKFRNILTIYIIIFLCFILFLFYFFNKIIISPIYRINYGLGEVSKDNFDYEVKIESKDEIGKLADSFEMMKKTIINSRKKLEEYNRNLEKKVKDRTKELEIKNRKLEDFNKIAVDRELKMIELKKEIEDFKRKIK